MKISTETKLVPLLGKPLSQSFAPRMQNETYKALGLDFLYFPLEVENDHLGEIVTALRVMNTPGFAVTKPNKIKILEYLDALDPLAEKMGAVNTVVKKDGKLVGYNTDGEGFVQAFVNETKIDPAEKSFFCFGAGGCGRAISVALVYHGVPKIAICDADDEAAKGLVEEINEKFLPVAVWVPFGEKEALTKAVSEADVVMNNTGLGMYTTVDRTPIEKEVLRPEQICFDATYNPLKTKFLKEAEEQGCTIVNGLGMSIYQGAIQVNLWSGEPEPIEIMTKAITQIVEEKQEKN